MQNKTVRTVVFVILGITFLAVAFFGGATVASVIPYNPLRNALGYDQSQGALNSPPQIDLNTPAPGETLIPDAGSGSTPADLSQLFAPFWESWKLLHENYVDQPLDDTALMHGAIQGMLAATGDKHTSYMDPSQFEQANSSMEGSYEGIGAWVDITGEYVQVVSPMKGSPAEAAGLKPKDIVKAVNGMDMTGTPGDLVLKKILGPAGQSVTLTIQRGETTFDVTIVRQKINVPVVDYRMLDNGIAYLALYTFNEQSTPQLRAALDELMAQNPKGLVFDLRDNGGGYLSTAIEVTSEFLPGGLVMVEEYGDGTKQNYDVIPGGRATEIPLAVLINAGSASASEITAGAIRDHGRGQLVGVTSYGKGSVQEWIPLTSEKGGVRITIARWLTPNGAQINGTGLAPDVEVPMTEADYAAGLDPQLDAAVKLLLGE